MTPALQGPDPEPFRMKVHGARWYRDILPADEIAPASDGEWPAVTTIKKAWSKPFRKKLPTGDVVPLDAYWAAEFVLDNLEAINALARDREATMAAICGAGGRTLMRAADRGTEVHKVLEDLGAGLEVDGLLLDDAVKPFLPACRAFIADWQPTWIAAEVIVVNRTIGFGGVADAMLAITLGERRTVLVDWKTRGGDHGAYEEEIAQIGGYSLGEYMIVRSPIDGSPMRMELPKLDGGLVVSLTSSGYQLYPVDLEEAQIAFRAMHVSWHEHREGQRAARRGRGAPVVAKNAAGTPPPTAGSVEPQKVVAGPPAAPEQPDPPRPSSSSEGVTPSAERLAWLRGFVEAIVEAGCDETCGECCKCELARYWSEMDDIPTFKTGGPQTDEQVNQVAGMCRLVEVTFEMSFHPPDPTQPQTGQITKPPEPPKRTYTKRKKK